MMPISLTTSVLTTLKTWFVRTTRSQLTIAFFVFVLASYAANIALHALILSDYTRHLRLVTSAIDAAGVRRGFTAIEQGVLELYSDIPTLRSSICQAVYNASAVHTHVSASQVQCAEGLTWLENMVRDAISEEVVYLLFESWLLVLSISALILESIPHLIVVLAAQIVKASWTSFRVVHEISEKRTYDDFVVHGACGGFDILRGSWTCGMFYLTLGLSITTLLGMLFFVFMLVKLYSKETLSSVGSCRVINQMLKWRLCMRVFLQLTAFFALASAVIWFCKRKLELIAPYSEYTLQDAGFYSVVIIIPQWLALGLHSISKENRLLFLVYAFLSVCLLSVSAVWPASALFRYKYMEWRFFSCVTTMADVLLAITCVLSIICRINFGRGLAHFLVVEQKLQAFGFAPDIFTHDSPSNSSKPYIDVGQVPSMVSASRPQSTCSVESAVIATWLPSRASEIYRVKCSLQAPLKDGEMMGSTVTIVSGEGGRSSFGIHSISSDN